ncbi:ABC transporter substrate-binding protein [Pandoraea apista]|uniref:ABC transporter substrate-binding protein n=2 Tax=Pandoraea apista TaxID=93218 RepID=A0ABX9ZN51_9BURK|nr:ABC transporter substrate-binding protein [Pandoraea apista]PTE01475.1 ABC transporter substrate-binding protein [Pandoraea apista]RRJ30158.1 ABC transporter substrate-binding protein [Pandoraea apista]RRJ74380.1 ABC transporter substrate-binding protein [Pandoraea apista]RSD08952.1 ABC transporter substrate-binding protein [Pandoraea apista]RSD09695.1 ABC transporter substrate-binding protein [Pandoraea apista]
MMNRLFQLARWFALASALLLSTARMTHAEEISVTQWGSSLYGLPYAVAMDKGLFKKAGVDITGILSSGGGGTTVRNILASKTPYGEVAVSAALAAARQGLDIVIVNAGTRSVAEASMVTMPGSAVRTLDDLVGKKVAITSPKSVSEMLFLMVLREKGIDASKVTRVASGGYVNGMTMLEQGAVAGAVAIEPLSILRKSQYRTLYRAGDVLKPMTTSVGITTRAFAQSHPDMLRAIIAGRRAGVDATYADPAGAARLLAAQFKLSPDIAREAVENMVRSHMWSQGQFDRAELDRVASGLKLIGEIKEDVDWAKLIDARFLPADVRAKGQL